jgi:hypothetical protein
MDETTWLTATDPAPMLTFPRGTGKASERQLRLIGVACCRRLCPRLPDARRRGVVEAVERLAEGEVDDVPVRHSLNEAYRAWEAAYLVTDDPGAPPDLARYVSFRRWMDRPYEVDPVARSYLSPHRGLALSHAAYAAIMLVGSNFERALAEAQEAVWFGAAEGQRAAVAAEGRAQVDLIRCVVGNPFRAVPVAPSVLAWNDGLVVRLAQTIYGGRRWGDMGVLADAFLDAGFDDDEVVAHLRRPGPHTRGCHGLDLLLKE